MDARRAPTYGLRLSRNCARRALGGEGPAANNKLQTARGGWPTGRATTRSTTTQPSMRARQACATCA
eukprot:11178326-Lingulodinium_polyedra.AAC.1